MELADLIRLGATVPPGELYSCAVREYAAGEIPFEEITPLYRHALYHTDPLLDRCPICDWPL